jgi:hypothetical protein
VIRLGATVAATLVIGFALSALVMWREELFGPRR